MVKIDQSFHLVEPNVGDAEIVSVNFMHPDVVLKIKLAQSGGLCVLRIHQCRLFWMTTDHPQNVIDGIVVGSSAEHLGTAADSRITKMVVQELSARPGKVVHAEPITGCGLIAVGDDVEVAVVPDAKSENSA